jgi:Uma2 family endonuclease
MRDFAHHRYTWAEYLAFERVSNAKNEFFNGEIYAMAGGTPEHAQLGARVLRDLGAQLRGKPCELYTSDLRIRVAATGLATYPDASIICGKKELDPEDANTVLNPTVLVEVSSPSTEDYDRGEKFAQYRQIPSLQEYVLLSHREPLIEVFRRMPGGDWARTEARPRASATLASVDCQLAVDPIYDGVFPRS